MRIADNLFIIPLLLLEFKLVPNKFPKLIIDESNSGNNPQDNPFKIPNATGLFEPPPPFMLKIQSLRL